ncbi:helix-turn-helix transcriptional regulator [uncultured Treponema sp.]|uniref:helix-turn-helix domain-containing protein n=1 Tax=Treponema sp. TaxID=166 RepID=UPI0025CC7843|nr:helix-turn-helix transcriptional regulator [uncultured Treponema sp.]MEE0351918.1 helix-turn-helix transcriptional regulator [Treponema sp.]
MTDILFVLGSNIRKIRKEFGWTQADLAEKSGISVPFMTQIELGRKSASLEVVQNIAAALNISYNQLFEENVDASNQEKTNLSLLEQNITSSVVKKIHEEFIKIK